MDAVLSSYLKDFQSDFSFFSEEESKLFEHFINYCVITKVDSDRNSIESVNVGGQFNPGIDGLAIIVNGHVVITKEQIEYFLEALGRLEVEFIFIQSKTSEKFEMKEIGSFLTCVSEFFNNQTSMKFGDDVLNLIDLKNYILSKSLKIEKNPSLKLIYAACGKWIEDDNIMAVVRSNIEKLEGYDIFSKIKFFPIDKDGIKKTYREIKNTITREIEFEKHTILPSMSSVTESFIGILPGKEYLKLICDENGDLLRNIFYDNVRDFQGFNSVNSEIRDSINQKERKDKFALLNNGVTIVAKKVNKLGYKFSVIDYQIVNGCQSSHVIYHLRDKIDDTVYVPIKLIITDNYDVTSSIIKATNRQTEVKSEAFEILSPFHKTLEEFYEAMRKKLNIKIYYERRGHQHDGLNIERSDIVTLSNQAVSFISMFLNEPHVTVQRYYGELLKMYKSKLFKEEHYSYPYFISGLTLSLIEKLFQKGKVARSFRRFKPHILMLLRRSICGDIVPRFNNNSIERSCGEIEKILLNEVLLEKKVKEICHIIQEQLKKTKVEPRNAHALSAFTDELLPTVRKSQSSGKISYYNGLRGYGFIDTGSETDIFFHVTEFQKSIAGLPNLQEEVYFDSVDGENGLKAININLKN